MHFTVEYPTRGDLGSVWRDNTGRIVDDYYSAVWTERFDEPGEATLELPMRYWPLAMDCVNYPNGHYLHFSESDYVMNLVEAKVKTVGSERRIVLKYKSLENFLSFRRTSWNAREWMYNNSEQRYYDITDVWQYEFLDADRYPVPLTTIQRYKDSPQGIFPDKWMSVWELDDIQVGDDMLAFTTAACRRGTSIRERYGFRFDVKGDERRGWNMRLLPTNPVYSKSNALPDWTEHIAALEFGFDTTEYSNAILETWPRYSVTRQQNGTLVYNESGSERHRSRTYNTEPVRPWNRVERYNNVTFPGTNAESAATKADQYAVF